jgi:pentatricopeptide repeat protein
MTKRECAIVQGYTGVEMLAGNDKLILFDYIEEITGTCGSVMMFLIDMYGMIGEVDKAKELLNEIKEASEPDFIKLCEESTDE